jgi:hypothetical protein
MAGIQCTRRLWLEVYHPQMKPELTAAERRVFDSGTAVGELARTRYPGGVLVEAPYWDFAGAVRETNRLLSQPEVPHLYEAAFEAGGTHVRADVLSRREEGSYRMVEVKSSSSLKEEHVTDVAIQWHVATEAGVTVTSCGLMHLNRECRYPDLSDLFVIEDVTSEARELLPEIPRIISRLRAVVAGTDEPPVPIGSHCTTPYDCPFRAHCWRDVPEQSIFTIPGLAREARDALAAAGIISIAELEAASEPPVRLSDRQQGHVAMVVNGKPVIDRTAIREQLAALAFPLWFLDFETCADAVPRLDGLGPWQNYPFQYSLHLLEADGALTHHEYLHEGGDDPRPAVARMLCEHVGENGSLIAYNATFEQGVIRKLAERMPDLAPQLLPMVDRFYDLLPVFRRHYLDPRFLGSASIKNVLPVLVPGLSYERLPVANGEDAQAEWTRAIAMPPGMERTFVLDALREYCKLDTLAMVRIYQTLIEL